MAKFILAVTTENKFQQDQHAHDLAALMTPHVEEAGGVIDAVVNQFGLTPALIVLKMPDGVAPPTDYPGVDMTGVEAQPV